MSPTLDDIRAEIVARVERETDRVVACDLASLEAHRLLDLAERELAAHDRAVEAAVAAFSAHGDGEPPQPETPSDIDKRVLAALTKEVQSIANQISRGVIRVEAVLNRLSKANKAQNLIGDDQQWRWMGAATPGGA